MLSLLSRLWVIGMISLFMGLGSNPLNLDGLKAISEGRLTVYAVLLNRLQDKKRLKNAEEPREPYA